MCSASIAYNESLKLEFRGEFDVDLFRRALQQVIERHPILMARFSSDGQWQELNRESTLDVSLLDLSEKSEKQRDRELSEAVGREVSYEFIFCRSVG